jgi:hypothetical protein
VIRDLAELIRYGRVRRRTEGLAVTVEEWRDGVRRFARREGLRIRTGLVELLELSDPVTRRVQRVRVVYAIRLDRPDRDGDRTARRPTRWERPPSG